jgi:cyclophilin family peptidyl-prolyl cis-trans isomerase
MMIATPPHVRWIRVAAVGLGFCLPLFGFSDDGIFAAFTTSQGSFRCELDYVRSPRAVANFIALATGTRPWLEEQSGRVRSEPFYDGLRFHRVIDGFMIQAGSPNGLGTDGPGYVFPDAFDPDLRHDGPGKLSMANSGPNSNGSQFYITVAATPWLDDSYTVFGRVVEGADVVDQISQVTTDEQDRPRDPVHLHSVRIQRLGPEAEAFDIHAQGLPLVIAAELGVHRTGDGLTLSVSRPAHADLQLRESTNLEDWTSYALGIELELSLPEQIEREAVGAARFYALTRVQYPSSTFAPRTLANRSLRLTLDGDATVLAIAFDAHHGGVYTFGSDHSGTVTGWSWGQEPYRGRLSMTTSGLLPLGLRLDFLNEVGGRLVGTAYADPPFSVSGTFTLDPAGE